MINCMLNTRYVTLQDNYTYKYIYIFYIINIVMLTSAVHYVTLYSY
jgi:hypothetical protein